tara:strand:+ start:915 stop:1694 length:780 start_codon:yes stop_codon:yes gene_type:complete
LTKQGAKKSRKEYYKRYGKSYNELKDFNILGFLGGGFESHTSGSSSVKLGTSSRFGMTDSVTSEGNTYVGMSYDVFTRFPLFKQGSNPHYPIYDLPTNMGIVRTRQRSITACENRLEKHYLKRDSLNKKSPHYNRSLKCIKRKIVEEKRNIKIFKHEMDYRLRFLNEIRKNIDISNKGSLRKPSKNGKWKSYYFRIYWWGKKDSVYLGLGDDLKMGFKRQSKFDDFDEYLKDVGRKRFLQRLGKVESNIRVAQRKLKTL